MLNDHIIIFILVPVVLIYIVILSLFFRNNKFKESFMKSYIITGLIVGVVYIIINIIVSVSSTPLVDYMTIIDYSENPLKTAEDVKEIINDQSIYEELSSAINSSDTPLKRFNRVKSILDDKLIHPLQNHQFHNKKQILNIINDITTFNRINRINSLIRKANKPEELLKDIIEKRKVEKIVRGISERTSEINSHVSTLTIFSENNISSASDLKIPSMFAVEDSTMFVIYKESIKRLIRELVRIDSEINIDNIFVKSDIRKVEELQNIKANEGFMEFINNQLDVLLDGIRDRITAYNNDREELGNPLINIDAGYIIGEQIRNVKAINTISLRLLQIRDLIAGSYLLRTFEKLEITNLEEVIQYIDVAISYSKTDSLVDFLYNYSKNPVESMTGIMRLHENKNKVIRDEIRNYIQQYNSIERSFSQEPNYDMNPNLYESLSIDLLEEVNQAGIISILHLKDMLKEDPDYQLFDEATISTDEESKKTLIENSSQILSDVVIDSITYRPEYNFVPEEQLDTINTVFIKHLIENLTGLIINKKRNFPRRRIVFLSDEVKQGLYSLAQEKIDLQINLLREIGLGIPDSIIDEEYKDMLSDNSELQMPQEIKNNIINYINPIIDRKLDETLQQIKTVMSGFISMDKIENDKTQNILNRLKNIITDKSLVNVSDRILSMGEEHELIQIRYIPLPTKINNIGNNSNVIQNMVIDTYNAFSISLLNNAIGFIISVLLWPLLSTIYLSGGYLVSHGSFLFYNTFFMVSLIIIGFITLLLPFIIGFLYSRKSSDNNKK